MFSLEARPKFPAVTFKNMSQTATAIDGMISLKSGGDAEKARDICERFCPHMKGGKIDCSGISSAGNARILVQLEAPNPIVRRPKWLRFRIARQFNAPCGVTFDDIKKVRGS